MQRLQRMYNGDYIVFPGCSEVQEIPPNHPPFADEYKDSVPEMNFSASHPNPDINAQVMTRWNYAWCDVLVLVFTV